MSDRHLKCGSYWALATRAIAAAMLAALAAIAPAQAGGVSVLTYHNDNSRTGWNPNETELTPTNVNASQFGLIFRVLLDGNVFAQPLYVPQVTIAGAPHNVVVAATENASVYAIDADTGAVLWRHAFPSSPSIRPASATCDCLSECYGKGPQGLTGTPTIDVGLDSIYVVARTNEYHGIHYVNYQLHALSIKSGADRVTPRLIELSAVATGGVTVRLSPKCNLQRPGLAEANGNIYVAFGSEGDQQPATTTGWLAAYDAQTLAPVGAFPHGATTAGGLPQKQHLNGVYGPVRLASVWMSGCAPAIDAAGNVYVQTGNGAFDGKLDWGMSMLKISPMLAGVLSYFTPSTYEHDNNRDIDLGSAGAILLPQAAGNYQVAVGGGKSGDTYLLNEANLGGLQPSGDPNVLFWAKTNAGLWGTPATYIGADGNTYLFVPGSGPMTAWKVTTSPGPGLVKVGHTPDAFGDGNNGGTIPVISSNGTTAGTAIVWAYSRSPAPTDITLRAYDAANLSDELIEIPFTKWEVNGTSLITPMVANGRVYAGGAGVLKAYGLLADQRSGFRSPTHSR